MTDDADNVHHFRPKNRKQASSSGPLTVVHNYGKCRHLHIEVDNQLAEVTCRDCKERLNPIRVLIWLANEDDRLRNTWARTYAALELMQKKTRCKCQHCGRLTHIPTGVSDWKLTERAQEIMKTESP